MDGIVYLVGARASGKTTIGRMLAQRLDADFVDTDALVVQTAGCEIADMVAGQGWAAFRACESGALAGCAQRGPAVVATGGGMVLARANRELMHATGTTFYLRVQADVLAARLAADPLPGQRPGLTDRDPAPNNCLGEVRAVLAEREELYRDAADHVVDAARAPEIIVETILKLLDRGAETL